MLASNSNTRFQIGGNTSGPNIGSNLRLDQVKVVNKELNLSEIVENYNSGVYKNPTDLSYYVNVIEAWAFNGNLNGLRGVYNLTSPASPVYSTDVPNNG